MTHHAPVLQSDTDRRIDKLSMIEVESNDWLDRDRDLSVAVSISMVTMSKLHRHDLLAAFLKKLGSHQICNTYPFKLALFNSAIASQMPHIADMVYNSSFDEEERSIPVVRFLRAIALATENMFDEAEDLLADFVLNGPVEFTERANEALTQIHTVRDIAL